MIRRSRPKITGTRIDYSAIAAAGGIPKGPSIQLEKGWKLAAFEAKLAKAYAKVDLRDDCRSRVTGRELFPVSRSDKDRREHNHLENRATAPDKITDPANIFLVSTYEHGFITRNELLIHGTNAYKKLTVSWNPRLIKPGREPFRIPSANRFDARKAAA
jgi:hypothetical protein